MQNRLTAVTGVAIIAIACAGGAGKNGGRAPCVLSAADSAFLARGPVYRDCAVDRAAHALSTNPHPDFNGDGVSGCFTADVEMVVDSLGRPEAQTAHVVRTSDKRFGDAVVATLSFWKYEPALLDGQPVRQIVLERLKASVGARPVTTDVLVPKGSPPPRPVPASSGC
jgi:hypothetical protein